MQNIHVFCEPHSTVEHLSTATDGSSSPHNVEARRIEQHYVEDAIAKIQNVSLRDVTTVLNILRQLRVLLSRNEQQGPPYSTRQSHSTFHRK